MGKKPKVSSRAKKLRQLYDLSGILFQEVYSLQIKIGLFQSECLAILQMESEPGEEKPIAKGKTGDLFT